MNKKISLVLSGGAARGLAHIGVIEELEAQGFEIKSIAGNSMGALIGAMYAMGKLDEYKAWALNLDKREVFKLIDFTIRNQGFIKGDKVFNKIKSFIPDRNIEELPIPFVAVAADITNMKEVIFTQGSIYQALRASIAIPTVFTPVKIEDIILVDGGVVNPIPLNRIIRTQDDILVASYVNAQIPYEKPTLTKEDEQRSESNYKNKLKGFTKKLNNKLQRKDKKSLNFFGLLSKSTSFLTHNLAVMNIDKYKPDLLINISHHSAGIFDFFKAEELIEAGKQAARKSILNIN